LQRERERRAELDAGAPLAPDVLTFERFAAEFLETYAVTNNKPREVETKRSSAPVGGGCWTLGRAGARIFFAEPMSPPNAGSEER
jgi:hypothetical protein